MTRRSPDERLRTAADCLSQLRGMKIMGSFVSASSHDPDGSRLLLRLKQAQLFEAISGPCPIAYEHTR
jgi:hypothetical protein